MLVRATVVLRLVKPPNLARHLSFSLVSPLLLCPPPHRNPFETCCLTSLGLLVLSSIPSAFIPQFLSKGHRPLIPLVLFSPSISPPLLLPRLSAFSFSPRFFPPPPAALITPTVVTTLHQNSPSYSSPLPLQYPSLLFAFSTTTLPRLIYLPVPFLFIVILSSPPNSSRPWRMVMV